MSNSLNENLNFDLKQIEDEIYEVKTDDELFKLEKKYFSKEDGVLTLALSSLKNFAPELRKEKGGELNKIKTQILSFIESQKAKIKIDSIKQKLKTGKIDVSAPANFISNFENENAYIHPLTKTVKELESILTSQNFSLFEGQDLEDDMHNFTYLNTPAEHPARSMHDTIYIDEKTISKDIMKTMIFHSNSLLLRTHTSPGQIRISKKILDSLRAKNFYNDEYLASNDDGLAFKFASIGKTYRNDNDATHSPMFHQMEVVAIGPSIYARDLMSMLADTMKRFFCNDSLQIRIRSSYFPFTQPSWEVDLFLEETNSWVEVLGAGMVHPNVIKNMGLNPDLVRGYAFGAGIERLCMLKYGISDLRMLYGHNLSWLAHQSQKINL